MYTIYNIYTKPVCPSVKKKAKPERNVILDKSPTILIPVRNVRYKLKKVAKCKVVGQIVNHKWKGAITLWKNTTSCVIPPIDHCC